MVNKLNNLGKERNIYSVWMRKNAEQNISEYERLLRSVLLQFSVELFSIFVKFCYSFTDFVSRRSLAETFLFPSNSK